MDENSDKGSPNPESSNASSSTVKRKNVTIPDVKPEKMAHRLDNFNDKTPNRDYSIIVSNIPRTWDFQHLNSYLSKYLTLCDFGIIEDNMLETQNSVLIYFKNYEKCIEAKKVLENEVIDGCRLIVNMNEEKNSIGSILKQVKTDTKSSETDARSELLQLAYVEDELDNSGSFGLRPEYLSSLGIKPPLTSWVHVSNFRTGKSELRDILELAGNVLVCYMRCSVRRYAKVMFSHPLEAVQAISMLNGQTFYGLELKVCMIEDQKHDIPKGLNDIGPGLGIAGKPIRDIEKHFQRFLSGKGTQLDTKLFRKVVNHKFDDIKTMDFKTNKDELEIKENNTSENKTSYHRLKFYTDNSDSDSSVNFEPDPVTDRQSCTNKSKLVNIANTDLDYCEPIKTIDPCLRSLHRNTNKLVSTMSSFRPLGPQPFRNLSQPRPNLGNPIQIQPSVQLGSRYPGPIMRPTFNPPIVPQSTIVIPDPVTVEFRNLPLTTTFPLLCQKLTEVGQIITLQLTAPGCAVVKFANRMQAENCLHRYHNTVAEGNVIEARLI